MKQVKLRTFQHGSAPKRGEGLRIGTTRRPPRGIPVNLWKKEGYFDVWFPILAPSEYLLRRYQKSRTMTFQDFCRSYERELLAKAESRQAVQLLAEMALRIPISVGCYCGDESTCHRSHLRKMIERAARRL